jgi:nucleotide-binding universal stress UspA family protein
MIVIYVMYRALIPVDRNGNRAHHQARYVSHLPNASEEVEATVLYVVPASEFSEDERVEFEEIDAAVRAAEHLEDEGITVTRSVDDGSVAEQIVRTATEFGADEIVVGGRKRSGIAKVLLGSIAQDVMLSAEQPVTLTGENVGHSDGLRQVLVPVDTDPERARHQAEYVAQLPAASEAVETTVFYVFPHQDYAGAPSHEFEEVDAAVEAAEYLEGEGLAVERVATGGEVARTIIDAAEDVDADSIVMGGRKRSGVSKVVLGSVAQDIALSAEYPVTLTG